MDEYIKKSEVIAEIEKRLKVLTDPFNYDVHTNRLKDAYKSLLSSINTLKVKVDNG